jgi:DNA-binding sugar fermentation-stimulating protein
MELINLGELFVASIIKRPSRHIKSPYVADIMIDGHEDEKLGHTPSLGCCGLADKESVVLVSKLGGKTKCDYRVQVAQIMSKGHTIYVGIAPKLAEEAAHMALKHNLVYNLEVKTINREKTIMNSRFDFVGRTMDDNYYICEVKTVPLADYADVTTRDRKKMDFTDIPYDEKIAYFPDGYRKNKKVTVSERALKHVQELMKIKIEQPMVRCVLLFVVQRTDVKWFQPSRLDNIYLEAVREAWQNGVEIKCLQVKWEKGVCKYHSNTLPIMLYDDYNLSL